MKRFLVGSSTSSEWLADRPHRNPRRSIEQAERMGKAIVHRLRVGPGHTAVAVAVDTGLKYLAGELYDSWNDPRAAPGDLVS